MKLLLLLLSSFLLAKSIIISLSSAKLLFRVSCYFGCQIKSQRDKI